MNREIAAPRNVDFECIFLEKKVSFSGKYFIYLGQHYVAGRVCYDIGAFSYITGILTKRHYSEQTTGELTQAAAWAFWNEFSDVMTTPKEGHDAEEEREGLFINAGDRWEEFR